MAFTTDIQSFESGLIRRMRTSFDQLRAASRKRRLYRQTFGELTALNQRELDDLGIARENIRDIAYQAAYGK